MTTTAQTSRAFDLLAEVYDETREPLDPETTQNLAAYASEHGWKSILEVGVGTGRIAGPLLESGFRVVGIDASRGMLRRAATKGVPHLVHGTAYHLPFDDRSFDVSLFVHVLHILDDLDAALAEAARVSRHGVLAVLDRPRLDADSGRPDEAGPRETLRGILAEAGFPDVLRKGPRVREAEILSAHPPREIRVLSDREVTEPLSRMVDNISKRAYRHLLDVPPEQLERLVRIAREKAGDRTVTYRRREAVVWWPKE